MKLIRQLNNLLSAFQLYRDHENSLLFTASAIVFSTTEIADSPAAFAVAAVAPAITDWSGLYAGTLLSLNNGRLDYFTRFSTLVVYSGMKGSHFGGFVGYNVQQGALIFGCELAYSMGTINWPVGYPDDIIENLLDVKARAGFATGNILIYGVAAYTMGHYDESNVYTIDATGFSIGAEMEFGEHMFAGVEYLARNISGPYNHDSDSTGDFIFDSIQLRAGWQF